MTESDEMKAFLRDPQKYFANELETAMKEGKRKANRAKITLVGPGRAGKTCVARSFLDMEFENTPSTKGIDDLGLRTPVHQAEAREGRWGKFREFDKMFEGYMAQDILYKRLDDETRPETKNKRNTKKRRRDESISVDEEFVQKTFGEIRSDGLGLVVSIHDFDVIHSFFLGPNGVYVVVFNMEWMSEDKRTCPDNLQSWVNALIVHSSVTAKDGRLKCASIALVGTHKDKVPDAETHQKISNELQKLLSSSVAWRSLLENESEGLCFFPVDCTQGQADPTMVNLMRARVSASSLSTVPRGRPTQREEREPR